VNQTLPSFHGESFEFTVTAHFKSNLVTVVSCNTDFLMSHFTCFRSHSSLILLEKCYLQNIKKIWKILLL